MRIDARRGDGPYEVYHAEERRFLKRVVWIDDDLHAYGEYVDPVLLHGGHPLIIARVAKRVLILPTKRLVVINPIEDPEMPETIVNAAYG